jgi:hypothetical protein
MSTIEEVRAAEKAMKKVESHASGNEDAVAQSFLSIMKDSGQGWVAALAPK